MTKRHSSVKILVLLSIVAMLLAATVFIPHAQEDASAASVDWTVEIWKNFSEESGYHELVQNEDRITDTTTVWFVIGTDGNSNNANFAYHISSTLLSESALKTVGWNLFDKTAPLPTGEAIMDGDNIVGYRHREDFSTRTTQYVYFRRTVTGDGGQTVATYYPTNWKLVFNTELTSSQLGIKKENITADYTRGTGKVTYLPDSNVWIGTGLHFTIKTDYMEQTNSSYDRDAEWLWYSYDGRAASDVNKRWIPMTSNEVTVNVSLNGVNIDFKVADTSEKNSKTVTFGKVYIDLTTPTFDVKATTDAGSKAYNNGSWTSSSVAFEITSLITPVSNVRYSYSVNGGAFMDFTSGMAFSETTLGLRFRATNEAGTYYDYAESYNVRVDLTRPGAVLEATTPDPEDEKKVSVWTQDNGKLAFDTDAYTATISANGQVTVRVFNRNVLTNAAVVNPSGITVYYAFGEAKDYFDEKLTWRQLSSGQFDSQSQQDYYAFSDSIPSNQVTLTRTYSVFIVSGAGLKSNLITFTVNILNSDFTIDVLDISFNNDDEGFKETGWYSRPITIEVVVPTDQTHTRGSIEGSWNSTIPTLVYYFTYLPSNVSGVSYTVKGEYSRPYRQGGTDDLRYDPINGFSVYKFELTAAAESQFYIYAINGAGKRSKNTYLSDDEIRIDTVVPEYEVQAYVFPADNHTGGLHYIKSGDWVNGRIILMIYVKIGVSGVYLVDMQYGTDSSGRPTTDSNGNVVWTEAAGRRESTENQEIRPDGSRWNVYKMEIGVPDANTVVYSREYRFRVYTESGVHTRGVDNEDPKKNDIRFIVNIDLNTTITFRSVKVATGSSQGYDEYDGGSKVTVAPMWEAGVMELFSNVSNCAIVLIGQNGYVRQVNNTTLEVNLPQGVKGNLVIRFYLRSLAVDEYGNSIISEEYEIEIPYNSLEIVISRELVGIEESLGVWYDLDVTVRVNLLASDIEGDGMELSEAEKRNYTYYYMLIDYRSELENNPNALTQAVANGVWIESKDGGYVDGVYEFAISFVNDGFYGYLALSVTNEAGFRSSDAGAIERKLRIDRTTPVLTDAVIQQSGIMEESNINNRQRYTYYSNLPITVQPTQFDNRSHITYYYVELDEAGNPLNVGLGGEVVWTELTGGISVGRDVGSTVNKYGEFRYALRAENELGKVSGGISDGTFLAVFTFIIDFSDAMSGTIRYETISGGGYFDPTTGMYSFMWVEEAVIWLKALGVNTQVTFEYRIDGVGIWEPYVIDPYTGKPVYYDVGEEKELVFNQDYFGDGVNGAFSFRAVSKAGAIYEYEEKIYIAIDVTIPQFEIDVRYFDGSSYTPGNLSLSDDSGPWANKPLTIMINITTGNVSGIHFEYEVEYLLANESSTTTARRSLPSSTEFTTDRLDGFGYNRDAILKIYATSRANSDLYSEQWVRIRVDQVIPVFTLTGHATRDDSSEAVTIVSDQWTNRPHVSITKAASADYVNVSAVTYTYTTTDLNGNVKTDDWPIDGNPSFDRITTVVVHARTAAGLEYTQTFQVNIDTVAPLIRWRGAAVAGGYGIEVLNGENYYIDLNFYIQEDNIEICEYITTKGDTRGFALDPNGYIISTSSVDNQIKYDPVTGREYRGYVKIYVKDFAGNEATLEFYMLPFGLDVNNITLSDNDLAMVDKYESDLNAAESYMESARVTYFRNLISRLRDRIATIQNEIETYRAYLERLAQRTSFELRSDYREMFDYLETFNNYPLMGQGWMQDAITGDASSKYYGYFQNLELVFAGLRGQMEKVNAIEESTVKLPAINVVTASDYNDVLRVYDGYTDLTADQKACFTTNLYTKLLALKKRCEVLLLADSDTGISMDAGFAPGARIRVETFDTKSEYYTNAQAAVLSAYGETDPRAVIAIYRISLVGVTSQTATGDIVINMPIPEDYRQYIRFAVYKMGADGTVSMIPGMMIEGDGRSVTFTSDELATFVLAARANIQVADTQEDSYGTFLGLNLDVEMIQTLAIIGISLFVVILIVVIIVGIRHRRFLNTYNRAYKSSIYRRGIQRIPKGNTLPRENPNKEGERVKEQKKAY